MPVESGPSSGNHVMENLGSEINLKETLLKYFQYWWIFILSLFISLLASWIYLRYTTFKYTVSGTLLIRSENTNRGGGGAEEMFSDLALFQSSTNKQNEIEILLSRTLMESAVRKLGLQKVYYAVGNVKKPNIYRQSPFEVEIIGFKTEDQNFSFDLEFVNENSFKIGKAETISFFEQIIDLPQAKIKLHKRKTAFSDLTYKNYIFKHLDETSAAQDLLDGLEVAPANDMSNVLRIKYVSDNPELGSDIVNQLTREYSEAGIKDKNEINRKIITFIDERLSLVENQLDSVETNLQIFKTNKQVIDLQKQSEFYYGSMSGLDQDIRNQEIQLQVVKLLIDYLKNPQNRNSFVPSTLGLSDATLLSQVQKYNEAVNNRERLVGTGVTSQNPLLQSAEKEIESLRSEMILNLNNVQSAVINTIEALNRKKNSIQSEISSIPSKEKESREKARQQEIKQNLYLYLLQKKEEASIAQASTISNSRVIDEALSKIYTVSPKSLRIYGIAFIVGLVLPIIFVYLIELFNDKVTRRSDITKVTNAPIISEIAHNDSDSTLLFDTNSRSVIAEQFRILRSNLKFVLGDKSERPTILVTSSFSGEGKSFISTNLGASLAVSGKKTVILEFDLRKPKVAVGLGLSKEMGLTNYLVGNKVKEELPQKVNQIDNLYIISCGPVPPNPSEILLSPKISELFSWLKNEFEAIVIDTAPVGLVSDAVSLSAFADSTLYIVRQRYTYKKQLQFVNELYKDKKLPTLGLVVNDVIPDGTKGYYGYGSGKYGYGYGYGYGNA